MAIGVYLHIEGIKGESRDDKHKDWIECASGSHLQQGCRLVFADSNSCGPMATVIRLSAITPGIEAGSILAEHVNLKFSKVKWKYTQQKIGGGSGGSTMGGWDLAANKIAA